MKHPIYLFIMDEMRADTIGEASDPIVKTPNLDALTKDAVEFTQCFCECPMCAPSRVSMATGMYGLSHGALDNQMAPMANVSSLYKIFYDNGYHTLSYGRWHTNCSPESFGFEKHTSRPVKGDEQYISGLGIHNKTLRKSSQYRKLEGEVPLIISGTRPPSIAPEDLADSVTTEAFIHDLKDIASQDKPLFARVGYINPHTPYLPCEKYSDMYSADNMIMNDAFCASLDNKPLLQQYFYKARGCDRLKEQDYKEAKASYYGLITHVDDRIGQIMDKMKELDLYDDAIIIFTSDHGSMMGEHGFVEKWGYMYDQVARVPLFIKFPKNQYANTKIRDMVSLIDVLPSLLAYNGIEVPKNVQGQSFLPMIDDVKYPGSKRQEVYSQYFAGGLMEEPALMVRDKNWKLTWYRKQETLEDHLYMDHPLKHTSLFDNEIIEGEFYDLKKDPYERVNLYNDKRYEDIKQIYMNKLKEHIKRCQPCVDYHIMQDGYQRRANKTAMYMLVQGNNMRCAIEGIQQNGGIYQGVVENV